MSPRRDAWRAGQPARDPARLVFLDETWASTDMSRRHGRGPRGQRLVCPVPYGHWKTTTFVAALRQGGVTAPLVIDGPVTGALCVAYVEQRLLPTLRPGDVAVRDDLSSHKRAAVREKIEGARCSSLCLPPYSPDLSPIALAFSKLKTLRRTAAERTVPGLWSFLGRALDAFAAQERKNYFRHCGYGPPDATANPKTD